MRINWEKLSNRLIMLVGIIATIVAIKAPFKQPTTWDYYDALDQGMTWNEYMEVAR